MYTVEVKRYDGTGSKVIWDYRREDNLLRSGTIDKAVDQIDEFKFELIDTLTKFDSFLSLVEIRNVKRNKVVFRGRILIPSESIGEDGMFSSDYTVEGAMGYLHDSHPDYNLYTEYTPQQYAKALLDMHNAQVESYKQIKLGTVSFTPKPERSEIEEYDTTKYSYTNSDKTTMQHLIDEGTQRWGGELSMRYEADGNYLDWLSPDGPKKQTELRLGKNIKSFSKSVDPTNVVTRLIPLGYSQDNHVGQSVRLTVKEDSRSGGKSYIDIPELKALYGIQTGVEVFDDIQDPWQLMNAGLEKINELKQDFAKQQVQVNLLDLFYLDYDPDEFERGAQYRTYADRFINGEWIRIVGTNEDITMPHNKTVTIGERQLTIADVQTSAMKEVSNTVIKETVPGIIDNQVPSIITATVPELIEGGIADFQDNSLGQIIENTIDANKEEIKDAVVDGINKAKNVIKSDAIVVDTGMINKLMTDDLLTKRLVADTTYTKDFMALKAVIDQIKATSIEANSATFTSLKKDLTDGKQKVSPNAMKDFGMTTIDGGTITTDQMTARRLNILRSDGAYVVNNGEVQFGLTVWRYYPQFTGASADITTVNNYFRIKTSDYKNAVFDAFAFKHESAYLVINLQAYGSTSGRSYISVEGFAGTTIFEEQTVTSVNATTVLFRIFLGKPTGELKCFYLKADNYENNYVYVREILVHQEG